MRDKHPSHGILLDHPRHTFARSPRGKQDQPQPITKLTSEMLADAHTKYTPLTIYSRVDGVTRQLLAATYNIKSERNEANAID